MVNREIKIKKREKFFKNNFFFYETKSPNGVTVFKINP